MSMVLARTEAEEQLAKEFARLEAGLPGKGWIAEARADAMRKFRSVGLPHRRIEEWKYTDVRAALKEAFPPAPRHGRPDGNRLAAVAGAELMALPAVRLFFVNGHFSHMEAPEGAKAPGTDHVVHGLASQLGQPGPDWMKPLLAFDGDAAANGLLQLNTALATDGFVLRVEAGAALELPVHVVFATVADGPSASTVRNFVKVDDGATATVIESYVALGDAPQQMNSVTQIHVGDDARLHHIKTLADGAASVHAGTWMAQMGANATYRGFQLTAGAGLARNETHIGFTGPDAKLDLSGLMLGRGSDHIDTTLVVDHTTTGCEGRELFKAVLDDRARAVFQGKVIVAAEAQKTDGKQMAQALMLSPDTEFDSKPELEIYADDVACGHGSTAAELDGDMLFYLRSRGIPMAEARRLLIQSFAAEALEKIDDEATREAVRGVAMAWLAGLKAA